MKTLPFFVSLSLLLLRFKPNGLMRRLLLSYLCFCTWTKQRRNYCRWCYQQKPVMSHLHCNHSQTLMQSQCLHRSRLIQLWFMLSLLLIVTYYNKFLYSSLCDLFFLYNFIRLIFNCWLLKKCVMSLCLICSFWINFHHC